MEQKIKISPFQLTVLLILSRLFSVMAYAPEAAPTAQNGVSLLTTILSPLVQYLLIMVAAGWCTSDKGVSPLFLDGKGARMAHVIFSFLYWAFSILICLYTLIHFVWFLSTSFYEYREAVLMTFGLVVCGGFAVSQGLEAFSRAGAVFAAVILGGLAVIAVGLRQEYSLLNVVRHPFDFWRTVGGVGQGVFMNFELPALLLMMPYTRRKRMEPRMAAGWLGAVAVLSLGIIAMTAMSLGEYGGAQMFPVFAAASSAQLLMFQHLDAVFMAIWVLLGLVRITVFLFLAAAMWGELMRRQVSGQMVWINTGMVMAICFFCLSREFLIQKIFTAVGSGVPVIAAVAVLPLIGRLIRGRAEREKNEE